MKKLYPTLLLLITVFLFSSCEFKFSEDYFNEIEITDPTISFILPNFSKGETITKPKYIEYSFTSEKNTLNHINFYVDNEFITQNYNEDDSFFLDITNLSQGNHTLKIEIIINSNTGSLAELTVGETYVASQDFNFNVNKEAIPLNINSVELIDGSIKISFDSYELVDEIERSITPYLNIESDDDYNRILLSKQDIENGFYIDTNTIGTNIKYKTQIENYYNNVNSEPKSITIPDTFNLQFVFIDLNNTKITWSKHALYNNVGSIDLYLGTNNSHSSLDVNGGEKFLPSSIIFGLEESYTINLHSKNSYWTKQLYHKIQRGETFETPGSYFYQKFIYLPKSNKVYALLIETIEDYPASNPVKIIEFNPDTFKIINSTIVTTSTNYFGDLTIDENENLLLDLNSKSMLIDGISLSTISEHNISSYSEREYGSIVRFRKNTVVIDNVNTYNTVKIYDISSKKLLLSERKSEFFDITLDGTYFSLLDKIYKKDGETLTQVYQTSANSHIIGFQENSNQNTIYFNTYNSALKEFNKQSKTASEHTLFDTLNPRYFNFLEDQNKFLVFTKTYYSETKLHIIDATTQERKSINLYNSRVNGQDYFFFNNTLVSIRGFYIKDYL